MMNNCESASNRELDSDSELQIVEKQTVAGPAENDEEEDEQDPDYEDVDDAGKQVIKLLKNGIEKNLKEKAAKANLPPSKVKNIIRQVVQSEHLAAFLTDDPNVSIFEPKITRAKSKQLKRDPIPAWSPTKKPSEEVQQLLNEEELLDESDEEYVPETPYSQATSILDASREEESEEEDITSIDNCSQELDEGEEEQECIETTETTSTTEDIAKRTRSKFDLNSTPLEEIETAFMPPDITTDMYNMDCEDDVWTEFLKTFTKPLDEVVRSTEDEDLDPEYNILADSELDCVDKDELREELRVDKGVNITKKELNVLMNELCEFTESLERNQKKQKQQQTAERLNRRDNDDDGESEIKIESISQTEPTIVIYVNQSQTNNWQPDLMSILQQQMRQHVQLLTQNFLLTYEHPDYAYMASIFREELHEIKGRADLNPHSYFNAVNIHGAVHLIEEWETLFDSNSKELYETKMYVRKVIAESVHAKKAAAEYIPTFPPLVMEKIAYSDVFLYPHLLPRIPFKSTQILGNKNYYFTNSENHLIAMYLEDLTKNLKHSQFYKDKKSKSLLLNDVYEHLHETKIPWVPLRKLTKHIKEYKSDRYTENPIKYFFRYGKAPVTEHFVTTLNSWDLIPPAHRNLDALPYLWKTFIEIKRAEREEESFALNCGNQTLIITPLVPLADINAAHNDPSPSTSQRRKYVKILPKPTDNPVLYYTKRQRRNVKNKNVSYHQHHHHHHHLHLENMLPDMPSLTSPENRNEASTSQSSTSSNNATVNSNFLENATTANNTNSNQEEIVEKDNIDDINELLRASGTVRTVRKEIGAAEKKKLKLRKEFMSNLKIATPETLEQLRRKEDIFVDNFVAKLRECLDVDDYKKMMDILCAFDEKKSEFLILYKDIQSVLSPKYNDLSNEFLLFLTQVQAQKVGQLMPYFVMKDMSNFIKKLYIYFKDQPNQIKKIIKSLTELSESSDLEMEKIKATILPLLKGNTLLTGWFLQLFPSERPHSILMNGPAEYLDISKETIASGGPGPGPGGSSSSTPIASTPCNQSEDLYETIVVPDSGGDPYGGPNCVCDCHKRDDAQYKSKAKHCTHCAIKFIQGRVYLQSGKSLRPAIVSFLTSPEKDHNKRLSVSSHCTKRKNDNSPTKSSSPSKEHPDQEKTHESEEDGDTLRKKFIPRTPRKRKHRSSTSERLVKKQIRRNSGTKEKSSPKDDLDDGKTEQKRLPDSDNEFSENRLDDTTGEDSETGRLLEEEEEEEEEEEDDDEDNDDNDDEEEVEEEEDEIPGDIEQMDADASSSWTREEDRLILQTFQQRTNDTENFKLISDLLRGRTITDIRNRFNKLMSLLQEMAYSSI